MPSFFLYLFLFRSLLCLTSFVRLKLHEKTFEVKNKRKFDVSLSGFIRNVTNKTGREREGGGGGQAINIQSKGSSQKFAEAQ